MIAGFISCFENTRNEIYIAFYLVFWRPVENEKEEEIGVLQLESGGDSSKEESNFVPEV